MHCFWNEIIGNGLAGSGIQAGVYLTNAQYCTVSSNRIYDGSGIYQIYGIQEGPSCSSNALIGNTLQGNPKPILWTDSTTIVKDNIGFKTEAYGDSDFIEWANICHQSTRTLFYTEHLPFHGPKFGRSIWSILNRCVIDNNYDNSECLLQL